MNYHIKIITVSPSCIVTQIVGEFCPDVLAVVLCSLRVCLLVLVTSRVVIVGMDGGLASWRNRKYINQIETTSTLPVTVEGVG